MSGTQFVNQRRGLFWELADNGAQRKRRAKLLRAFYALVDPDGWDAKRLATRPIGAKGKAQ